MAGRISGMLTGPGGTAAQERTGMGTGVRAGGGVGAGGIGVGVRAMETCTPHGRLRVLFMIIDEMQCLCVDKEPIHILLVCIFLC